MRSGQILAGRYRLADQLGAGGMSVVWRAHDELLGRDVAIKVLAVPGTDGRGAGAVRAEATAAASLTHPHIASVFDYGEAIEETGARVPFVVMELLVGAPLAELAATGPLAPGTILCLCAQVADALAAAHERGVVHRDVKPANVMVTPVGAKVFDFGIAAAVGADDDAGPQGPIVGTISYVAPERLVGAPVSPASDVYSLGLMLFRLLTREAPWPECATPAEVATAHLFLEPPELPHVEGVPDRVVEVYRRCVAKNPADRPTAGQVAAALAIAAGAPALLYIHSRQSNGDAVAVPVAPPVPRPPGRPDAALGPPTVSPSTVRRQRRRASVMVVAAALIVTITLATSAAWPPAGAIGTANAGVPRGVASMGGAAAGVERPSAEPRALEAVQAVASTASTFRSASATIVAGCVGASARLRDWRVPAGFRVRDLAPGPAPVAGLTVRAKKHEITMSVRCVAATPVLTVSADDQRGKA